MDKNTQITNSYNYDVSRMIFSDPISGTIPDSKPAINYSRVMINTKYDDGTEGDLILETEKNLFSFGVGENTNPDTGKVSGYSFPIALHTKTGATENEKKFVETLDKIVERCKDYLVENREEIGKYELERSMLKPMSAYYIKKEKGKIAEGATPTLYPKLIVSKKQDKIVTMFYDDDENPVDPMTLLGKYCTVHGAIKIESIFIGGGNKISLQIKLYEAKVKPIKQGMPRLLAKSAAPRVLVQKAATVVRSPAISEGSVSDVVEADAGSLEASDDDDDEEDEKPEPPKEEPKATKKVVRRVVKK
jgi:hypothetical protein